MNDEILIGGLEKVIHSLHELLIYPLEYPNDFQALNIEPPKGMSSSFTCLLFFILFSSTFHLFYPLVIITNSDTLGVLLYGPPGCGKTLVVRKVAQDSQLPLLYLDAPQIIGYFSPLSVYARSFVPNLRISNEWIIVHMSEKVRRTSEENSKTRRSWPPLMAHV